MTANWKNRTVFTGDNLDVLRGMNSESVDLIYLDPPFNSNKNYSAPIGSRAAGAAFKDAWALSDVDEAWHGEIADREPALYAIIDAARLSHGKGMKAYLIMLAVRLLELRRVLKETGSLYLHCDPTASHYLKLLMDCVFGKANFRNEIVWHYEKWTNAANFFQRNHDLLLFYGKGPENHFNKLYGPHSERQRQLLKAGYNAGSSGGKPIVRIYDREKPEVKKRLSAWVSEGRAIYDVPPPPGKALADVWPIPMLNGQAKERTGYPTQKPLALLDRIIKASSKPGDAVLDPFCGCATALVAAEKLGRQWVGIDLSPLAVRLVQQRLQKDAQLDAGLKGQQPMLGKVTALKRPLKRTDLGDLPDYRTHKHTLYGKQEGVCAGCETHFPFRNFTIDHKTPQAKGGSDHLDNLQLLCGACNSAKGQGTQAELKAKLKRQGVIQ